MTWAMNTIDHVVLASDVKIVSRILPAHERYYVFLGVAHEPMAEALTVRCYGPMPVPALGFVLMRKGRKLTPLPS